MRLSTYRRMRVAVLLLWGGTAIAFLSGQTPDLAWDSLPAPEGLSLQQREVQATVRLYSDGHNLTLFAEVIDPRIRRAPRRAQSDHLELWLALSPSAFPEDFVYSQHPEYILAPPAAPQRGATDPQARLFLPSPRVPEGSGLAGFLRLYPQRDTILRDSMNLPLPERLRAAELPLGLIGIALFPDGRPAELINAESLARAERWLGLSLQPAIQNLRYTAERREDRRGYILNAEISPRSLGFFTLPELRQLQVAVRVADVPQEGQPARIVRTTTPGYAGHRPSQFTPLTLRQPLYLDIFGVSDSLLYQANLQPLFLYGEQGWYPVHIDVDALVYRPFWSSEHLLEWRCTPLEWTHSWDIAGPYDLEHLIIGQQFVSELPRRTSYLRLHSQLVTSQRSAYVVPDPGNLSPELFQFPDGKAGFVQYESHTHHPFGWGTCGTCLREDLRILRITPEQTRTLLTATQWDGPDAYCQIGDLRFNGYYLSHYDWIQPGNLMVFVLAHRLRSRLLRRVKVSWNASGEAVEVVEVD